MDQSSRGPTCDRVTVKSRTNDWQRCGTDQQVSVPLVGASGYISLHVRTPTPDIPIVSLKAEDQTLRAPWPSCQFCRHQGLVKWFQISHSNDRGDLVNFRVSSGRAACPMVMFKWISRYSKAVSLMMIPLLVELIRV